MKELRLEVGKAYTNGNLIIIIDKSQANETYPFIGSDGMSYMANGRYFLDELLPGYDLEEEVEL